MSSPKILTAKNGKIGVQAKFDLVDIESVKDEELDAYPDRTIFQTRQWVNFIAHTQRAEPVMAVLRQGNRTLGYFTGLIVRKFGFKILGSPFPGWSTFYMGLNLRPGISRSLALEALTRFAFKDLKCHHLELMDRHISKEDYGKFNFEHFMFNSFEIDLTPSEEQIFRNMKHQCRNCIRKAEKSGVVIEEADDIEFADEYCAQRKHVFAVNSSVPRYGANRVRELIKLIYPTGKLLLLRARNKHGICIATGIFPAMNDTMYASGQASWRHYSNVRPNEAMFWYAMKYWKRRGMRVLDMLGGGDYTRKYGAYSIGVPWIRKSKNRWIAFLRTTAQVVIQKRERALGKLANKKERLKLRNIGKYAPDDR